MKHKNKEIRNKKHGSIIITVLVFAAVAVTIIIGLVNWSSAMLMSVRNIQSKEQAFQIAEAGIDYYQWHLAQTPNDYKDGTTTPQPYVHSFYDKDGNLLGTFSLTITPPPVGSTKVTIVSKGTLSTTTASTTISRTIKSVLAIPSLAKYAAVANDNMRFGAGTEVFGPIHANGGIRFDGLGHNLITSAMATYTDPDPPGNLVQYGVYNVSPTADPQPPGQLAPKQNIFMAGRQFPVPRADFAGLTAGLSQLQTLAQNGGKEWTPSNKQGYHVVLRTDGKYDLYKVTALQVTPNNCGTDATAQSQNQWGIWTIRSPIASNQTLVAGSPFTYPGNGVIFFDDHVWVDGQINTARLTIVAGIIGNSDPTKNANITVNSDLKYTNYDGSDVLGLIAQGNVNVGLVSNDDLQVDAALVAENGRVGRFYYNTNCIVSATNYWHRNSLTLNGMIATYIRYGFAYTGNSFNCGGSVGTIGSGYCTRNINYDGNLLYAPPPSFPSASSQYQVISWQEL
jgi:hypothetical protein